LLCLSGLVDLYLVVSFSCGPRENYFPLRMHR
jgi:hypothetical protein